MNSSFPRDKDSLMYCVSNDDIHKVFPKANIIRYDEIIKYNNIMDLIGPSYSCFILYETEDGGHWVTVYRNNYCLGFFDSYGIFVDDEFKYIPLKIRRLYNETIPHLRDLMFHSNLDIDYNRYKLQKMGVNTCGKHCIVRLLHKDISSEEYGYKLIQKAKSHNIDADDYVNIICEDLI